MQRLSNDDYLENKGCQNGSTLYCALQLCTVLTAD